MVGFELYFVLFQLHFNRLYDGKNVEGTNLYRLFFSLHAIILV